MRDAREGFVAGDPVQGFHVKFGGVSPESYFTTDRLVREIARLRPHVGGALLDVGCGTMPYAVVFEDRVTRHVGVDVPTSLHGRKRLAAFAGATALPFADGVFDTVLCSEVLEHVAEPGVALGEIARVARGGATVVVSTPFMYRVHEAPYDFYRYTPFAMKHLAEKAGLEIVEVRPRGGFVSTFVDLHFKASGLGVGALNRVVRALGMRQHLKDTAFVHALFYAMSWPLARLWRHERVVADQFTPGYIFLMRKRGGK